MPEGKQAAVAQQQVEGAGEEREAEHLHQEDRVEEERRDQQEHQEPGEDRHVVPRHAERRRLGGHGDVGYGLVGHHAALPNSPAGFTSRTSAMMTKITTADPSG